MILKIVPDDPDFVSVMSSIYVHSVILLSSCLNYNNYIDCFPFSYDLCMCKTSKQLLLLYYIVDCMYTYLNIHNFNDAYNDAYKILLLHLFGEPCPNNYTKKYWIIGNCPLVYWFLEMCRHVSMCFQDKIIYM